MTKPTEVMTKPTDSYDEANRQLRRSQQTVMTKSTEVMTKLTDSYDEANRSYDEANRQL
jgi:hypothetical protein